MYAMINYTVTVQSIDILIICAKVYGGVKVPILQNNSGHTEKIPKYCGPYKPPSTHYNFQL